MIITVKNESDQKRIEKNNTSNQRKGNLKLRIKFHSFKLIFTTLTNILFLFY